MDSSLKKPPPRPPKCDRLRTIHSSGAESCSSSCARVTEDEPKASLPPSEVAVNRNMKKQAVRTALRSKKTESAPERPFPDYHFTKNPPVIDEGKLIPGLSSPPRRSSHPTVLPKEPPPRPPKSFYVRKQLSSLEKLNLNESWIPTRYHSVNKTTIVMSEPAMYPPCPVKLHGNEPSSIRSSEEELRPHHNLLLDVDEPFPERDHSEKKPLRRKRSSSTSDIPTWNEDITSDNKSTNQDVFSNPSYSLFQAHATIGNIQDGLSVSSQEVFPRESMTSSDKQHLSEDLTMKLSLLHKHLMKQYDKEEYKGLFDANSSTMAKVHPPQGHWTGARSSPSRASTQDEGRSNVLDPPSLAPKSPTTEDAETSASCSPDLVHPPSLVLTEPKSPATEEAEISAPCSTDPFSFLVDNIRGSLPGTHSGKPQNFHDLLGRFQRLEKSSPKNVQGMVQPSSAPYMDPPLQDHSERTIFDHKQQRMAETSWTQIAEPQADPPRPSRPNSDDYIKLEDVLKLQAAGKLLKRQEEEESCLPDQGETFSDEEHGSSGIHELLQFCSVYEVKLGELYGFTTENFLGYRKDMLSFSAGSLIRIIEVVDETFLWGENEGRQGIVPRDKLKIVKIVAKEK